MYGERRSVINVMVGKPERTRPLERPIRRWEDNINMDLQEVGECTGSIWLRIWTGSGTCECGNEPSGSVK
jgi:hypothetical protein